jgi:hypothetical protein
LCHCSATGLLYRIGNRDAVRIIAKAYQGQQNQQFEASKKFVPRHFINNTE